MIPICSIPVVFFVDGSDRGGDILQVPTVPRVDEIVAIDGMPYRVEQVLHAIDSRDEDQSVVFVNLTSKQKPQPHKRRRGYSE